MTVTVVVLAITDLFGRSDFVCATPPFAAFAGLFAFFALTCVSATILSLTVFAGTTFIDFTVTIVVFAVTDLDFGLYFVFADAPDAALTSLCSFTTGSLACSAGFSGVTIALEFFVGLAVAIVINTVTVFFVFGENFAFAFAPLTVDTQLLATFAGAYFVGAFGASVRTGTRVAVFAIGFGLRLVRFYIIPSLSAELYGLKISRNVARQPGFVETPVWPGKWSQGS